MQNPPRASRWLLRAFDAQEPQPKRADLPAQALQHYREPRRRRRVELPALVEVPRQLVEFRRCRRQFPNMPGC